MTLPAPVESLRLERLLNSFPAFVAIVFATATVIAFALALIESGLGSESKPVQIEVRIVDVYRTGIGFRETRTVVEMPDGTRRELDGRRGAEGEKVRIWMRSGGVK